MNKKRKQMKTKDIISIIAMSCILVSCQTINYSVEYRYAGLSDKPYYSLVAVMNDKSSESTILRVWSSDVDWTQFVIIDKHDIDILASEVTRLRNNEDIANNPKHFWGDYKVVLKQDEKIMTFFLSEEEMISHLYVIRALPFENKGLKKAFETILYRYGEKKLEEHNAGKGI